MTGNDEHGLTDVTLLRTIRDINGSPERYASTAQGVTPATVTAIAEATTLTETAVTDRLDRLRSDDRELVTVYEAEEHAAGHGSAELTEAGQRAIAASGEREQADAGERQPGQAASALEGTQASTGGETDFYRGGAATETAAAVDEDPDEADRIAALEERIERLEARADSRPEPAEDDRVDELADEIAALRETTDRLASTLDGALDELDAIRESEYGALDEKREKQFETAVKSMVAFHQLATEVLDVRVESYEPAAGRADAERVETTRDRIADALGVDDGDDGNTLTVDDDADWPDPEEAAGGGREFGGDEAADQQASPGDSAVESDVPDAGVYPPVGESAGNADDADDVPEDVPADVSEDVTADVPEDVSEDVTADVPEDVPEDVPAEATTSTDDATENADVPSSGVYPPVGGDRDDEATAGAGAADGSLPGSVRAAAVEDAVAEDAAVEDAVTEDAAIEDVATDDAAGEDTTADGAEGSLRLAGVAPASAREVREAVLASRTTTSADPYPDGEAYARIVGSEPVDAVSSATSADAAAETDDE